MAGEGAGRLPLHVTNGDAVVPALRATGLAREILPWRDVLHEGPVPDVPDDELRRVRAAFLAGEGAEDVGTADELAQRDRTLDARRDGEYVLWFEADLYDQLQLIQILARLRDLAVAPGRITLICIGEHLGIAHFGGLGELSAEQLGRLPTVAASPLTGGALEHAARAWGALRAPDPGGLGSIAETPSSELRFVAEAFDRLGREYPSIRDGLSLTERRILAAVADGRLHGRRRVRARRRPGGPAVPGRHLVLRPHDPPRRGLGAAAGDRARGGAGRRPQPPAPDRRRAPRARRTRGPRRPQRR